MLGKIHIGKLIKQRAAEINVSPERLAFRLKITMPKMEEIFKSESIDTDLLLTISKRLEFDFFRVFTSHMIIYSPVPAAVSKKKGVLKFKNTQTSFDFKKNVYSPEIIAFFIDKIEKGTMTINEVMSKYHIPKTTIYRWCRKYLKRSIEDVL